MRTWVDLDLCEGCASCVVAAPDVFDFDDEAGKVIVLVERPEPGQAGSVRTAALHCPVRAVHIDENG
jgi:ferredoxin